MKERRRDKIRIGKEYKKEKRKKMKGRKAA